MTESTRTHASEARLTDWIAGALDEAEGAAIEEHLLGCDACAARAARLLDLVDGVRAVMAKGGVQMAVTRATVDAWQAASVEVQEVGFRPDELVPCALPHHRGAIVLRLETPLDTITRLDLVVRTPAGAARFEDIAFDPASGAVLLAQPAHAWLGLPAVEVAFELTGHERSGALSQRRFVMAHGAERAT